MSSTQMTKKTYVGLVQGLGLLLGKAGVLSWLEKRGQRSRTAHWMRSLFVIHDMNGLVALDVPWWSYNAIEEVSRILRANPNAKVFEYGSGASTVWLARRAASVVSVEHHPGWHSTVSQQFKSMPDLAPVDLRLVQPDTVPSENPLYISQKSGESGQSFEAYSKEINAAGSENYDVIVIDGRARSACLKHAIDALADNGVIVFDNSHRKRYRNAIKTCGLEARSYRGLTPSLPYPDETTLLFHSKVRI